jgi:general secretion pathway protein L
MSVLVVLIPARDRLQGAGAEGPSARPSAEFSYVLSPDGLAVGSTGRCAPSLLPRADSVIAVLADSDVSWHRITLPKAPAARLRAALVGVLEEALLDDAESMHLALPKGAVAGQLAWVAAAHKQWLAAQLGALEQAGVPVERVVPASWPDEHASGHFTEAEAATADTPPRLTFADATGVMSIQLRGGLARTLLPQWSEQQVRWSAAPVVAAAAEQWLGAPVLVMPEEQHALQSARSLWNLRQFDLAPHRRGALALRDSWRHFMSPGWRPVRWGLVSLVLLQVVGINLWSWHQRGAIEGKRQAMVELLRSAHPQVRAVLDAPVQMQRETDTLRAAAGRPGESDLEGLLSAAAMAWPEGRAPIEGLRFEPGRLTFSAADWTPSHIEQFRSQLRSGGWAVESQDGRLTLSRAAAEAGSRS